MVTMIAIDQYGQITELSSKYPRKELLSILGSKKGTKIYVDKKDGSVVHTGYNISGLWFTLYKVTPLEKLVV